MLKALLIFILIYLYAGDAAVAQQHAEESSLKAVFVYNFTKYIDWGSNNEQYFTIGFIGSTPVEKALNEIASTQTVNARKIVIKHFNQPEEITHCDILYISANADFPLSSVLKKVGQGTLTIGEQAGFAEQGVAFNFILVDDKLKFEANIQSILNEGLKASSQLLKLAKIVDNKP